MNKELQKERLRLVSVLTQVKNKAELKLETNQPVSGATIGGIVYGNVSNASTIYASDKFATPRGHGFAAEQANHLYDKITNADFFGQGKVQIVGEEIDPSTGRIIKDGADRVVNGTNIQTKYCKTGGKCISECFENGKFRYLNSDGSPMQVEVPSDKYDAAIQAMENRIKNGEVPGVTDPEDAKKIVRKGHFTYEQTKNIAKAGTVESITFDAVNGAIIATSAFGISTVLSFATSVWNGDSFDVAIKNATYTGLKVGGTTFVTAVLASQLSKAGLNSALVSSSEAIVSIMGPKASALLVNAFRSGSNIYGAAAMKSAAKLLRGNAITGAVSVVVLSSVDVVNIFRGRISGKQLFKNVANTAATVAGGTAGWVGGATAGAAIGSVIPIVGTAVGGFIGGVLGSFAAGAASNKVSNTVLGAFIEDDAEEMVRIIEKVFQELATDYLLNQKEAESIVDALKNELTGRTLKDMFASSNRKAFAKKLLVKHIENEVKNRKKIVIPSDEAMKNSLRNVLEEIADMEKNSNEVSANISINNPIFKMEIEDIFAISGKGTVLTGKIALGDISVGDAVTIEKKDGQAINSKIKQIEMFAKYINTAKEGDHVGLLLDSVTKNDVCSGDIIVKYETVTEKSTSELDYVISASSVNSDSPAIRATKVATEVAVKQLGVSKEIAGDFSAIASSSLKMIQKIQEEENS